MKCRRAISRLSLAVVLAGCAGTIGTSYHDSDNFWNLGYSDVQLSKNVFRVTYAGYRIPQGMCDELALLRASDITREKGNRYFKILTETQSSHSDFIYLPMGKPAGFAGSVNYPVSILTIEILPRNNNAADTLDAKFIWSSLAPEYGVSPQL